MKISIDGGALCADKKSRYGNYIFSRELLNALGKYDKKNSYIVYTFCKNELHNKINYKYISQTPLWMSVRVGYEEALGGNDYFLALNQAFPLFGTRKVITFLHGLSFMFYPGLYPYSYQKMRRQLERAVKYSDKIIVSSLRVKDELTKLYPKSKNIQIVPFGVPSDMKKNSKRVKKNYFLYVGMDHQIKNLEFLKKTFSKFRKTNKNYSLKIINKETDRKKLKRLYLGATAYLSTSFYESFNLPVLEALLQNCPVIALRSAIIPEYKKFVNVVDSEQQFLKLMNMAAEGKLEHNYSNQVKNIFNWKNYVEKLIALYK